MIRRSVLLATATAALLAVAGSDPAVAEQLVLDDGSVIETRGAWRVKGRMVLFEQSNGTLSSLPVDMVDLEASEQARTPAAAVPKEADRTESTGQVEPVLVITDQDIKRAAPPAAALSGDAGEAGATDASATEASATEAGETGANPGAGGIDGEASGEASDQDRVVVAAQHLAVTTFRVVDSPSGGVEVTGVLVNRGERIVTDIAVRATLPTVDGADRIFDASVANPIVPAGGRTPFRLLLPDVVGITEDDLSFDLSGRAVRPRIVGAAASDDDTDAATDTGAVEGDGASGQR